MSDLMREEFEKKYKAPTGCYWNSMTGEYAQSWYELEGDDVIDKEIRIHNDRFLTWKASRECMVIELPEEDQNGKIRWTAAMRAIESTGAKVKP